MKTSFNLLGKKRPNEDSADPHPSKLPKASQISVEQGPRPLLAPKRLPVTAPVDVCIYRVTELASDLWDLLQLASVDFFGEPPVGGWVVGSV